MAGIDSWVILAGSIALVVGLVLVCKLIARGRESARTRKFVMEILHSACEQKSPIDLKLNSGSHRAGISADVESVSRSGLLLRARSVIADFWDKERVECYFRVIRDGIPIFFVFDSKVLRVVPDKKNITIAIPDTLRVEKKRSFIRAQPNPQDILMLGVWPISPGRRLPRANTDLGIPVLSWKTGQSEQNLQVENLSASGIALRFLRPLDGELPVPSTKGKQFLGMLVFRPEPNAPRPLVFLFSGEIMNVRMSGETISLGLEFTNWAVQQPGDTEIRWVHNSPWSGVKIIHDWVGQIEKMASQS